MIHPYLIVAILTKNEEVNIGNALKSAAALGPVLVVDSGSTDSTITLAREFDATVVSRQWPGYARQRQWVLEHADENGFDWVFFLDADERLDAAAILDVARVVEAEEGHGAYRIARRMFFLGRELRGGHWYPDYQTRLLHVSVNHFEPRNVHEHPTTDGTVGQLRGHILHDDKRGYAHFVGKHVNYAALEAPQRQASSALGGKWRSVRSRHMARQWLKYRVWLRLPFRPCLRLVWMLVVRGGWRDGWHGVAYALTIANYDFMVGVIAREAEERAQ